jgi:drug/metabolite transporter (DMT)-like permease
MPSSTGLSVAPRLRAALWVLASTLAFSVMFASGKLLGGAVPSLQIVLIKVLVAREGAMTMLLYVNGFAALLLALPAALIWHPLEVGQIAALSLLGPLAISGQFFNVRAYRAADAAFLAPFGYSALVFAAVIGWTCFGETPTAASYFGAALIVAGGVLLVRAR